MPSLLADPRRAHRLGLRSLVLFSQLTDQPAELRGTHGDIRIIPGVEVVATIHCHHCRVLPVVADQHSRLLPVCMDDECLSHDRDLEIVDPALEVRLGCQQPKDEVQLIRWYVHRFAVNPLHAMPGV